MVRRLPSAILAFVLVAAACGGDDDPTGPTAGDGMRIASASFAENELLAEMYAQVIESTGVPVVRLGPVGPREIFAPALESGLIDLVPEYLGSARAHFGATETDPATDTSLADLNRRLVSRDLTALQAARAEDKDVFAVTRETATRFDLDTISDLAAVAPDMRFGGLPECPDNPLCLAGLRDVYGLEFAEFVAQRSLTITAEALHRGEIEVGQFFSTASELEDPLLVVLEDDRTMQPAQNIIPLIRDDALDRWGTEVVDGIIGVSLWLTTRQLRFLNLRIARGEPIADVARDWLETNVFR